VSVWLCVECLPFACRCGVLADHTGCSTTGLLPAHLLALVDVVDTLLPHAGPKPLLQDLRGVGEGVKRRELPANHARAQVRCSLHPAQARELLLPLLAANPTQPNLRTPNPSTPTSTHLHLL